jgi:hypothetical protein
VTAAGVLRRASRGCGRARRWLREEGRPFSLTFICGPVLGAWIGFIQALSAEAVWRAAGEPDFYFRGEEGVVLHYIFQMFGGGLVGVLYGPALFLLERALRRRVRILLFLLSMTLLAAVVFLTEAVWIMSVRRLPPLLLGTELAVMAAGILILVVSPRAKPAAAARATAEPHAR